MAFVLVAAIFIFVLWRRKGLLRFDPDLVPFIVRVAAASAVMAIASWFGLQALRSSFDQGGTLWRIGLISIQIFVDGAVFLAIAALLKMQEAGRLFRTASSLLYGRTRA
jgi:peptidoglycan biosynthesis protein MviN/MurJ (putative lipid II flippase)